MKKELKRKKNELLADWYSRIACHYDGERVTKEELYSILKEVGFESYKRGSDTALEVMDKVVKMYER